MKFLFKICLIGTLLCFAGAFYLSSKGKVITRSYHAMGTKITISIAEKQAPEDLFKYIFRVFDIIENSFKEELDFNDHNVKKVFLYSKHLEKITNGKFSPYLGAVISLWGFDKYEKTITKVPTEKQIKLALSQKKLNLYAIAKGFAIDQAAKLLKQNDYTNFIINAGGDLYVSGTKFGKPWNIGIKDQKGKNLIKMSCDLKSFAVATSSNLYNYYILNGKKYGHLLNGLTGMPAQGERSVSVFAPNATIADGLATAVFVDPSIKNKIENSTTKAIIYNPTNKTDFIPQINDCQIQYFRL